MRIITLSDSRFRKMTDIMIHSCRQHNKLDEVVVLNRGGYFSVLDNVKVIRVKDVSVGFTTKFERLAYTYTKLHVFKYPGKWIFLDGDLIVLGSLKELWDSGHFSCVESSSTAKVQGNPMFNSGVFCYENVNYDDVLKFTQNYRKKTMFGEQDVLNHYFWGRGEVKLMDDKFNSMYYLSKKRKAHK